MTKKGYITKGKSGWTICFWDGQGTARYLHGMPSFQIALAELRWFWRCPPDYQNGFPTTVRVRALTAVYDSARVQP